MEMQALEKLIKGRRSVRQWKKQNVPDDLLKKAVELATWAPNGGNFQGWRFVVVKNPAVIEKMASSVQSVADKIAAWPEGATWKEEMGRVQKNSSYFRNAPACIGVFVSKYESVLDKVLIARESVDPEAKEILSFRRSAPTSIQSAAAAVTTLLLVLHNAGLGAVWLAAPLSAKKQIETILKAPADMNLVCLVAVGYPGESPQKDRRSVEEVLEFIR
ncbi:MAG: nitroreductase family protein [Deltaproteobacteria bacterium]